MEPANLKPKATGKKQRKVKMVGGFSAKEVRCVSVVYFVRSHARAS